MAQAADDVIRMVVNPVAVTLSGPGARFRLLVEGETTGKRRIDLTRESQFTSDNPESISVSADGLLRALADGEATITVTSASHTTSVKAMSSGTTVARVFHFENDIVPILSKFGCNSGGCHGKAEGQNGFKLSVFGFDPEADRIALKKEGRGRRVFPAVPEQSLLLQKVCGTVPHGGGVRIRRNSPEYKTLAGWIAAGMPAGDVDAARVVSIEVTPRERRMTMHAAQQLRVVAKHSDGTSADVTHLASFQSNNDSLCGVDEYGLVRAGDVPGEAAVMASYMGAVGVFRALIPRGERIDNYPDFPAHNFIDGLVHAKLKKLNIVPSAVCSDADYVRRLYLDVIGTLPTADESRAFLEDTQPDKRARLVDTLLGRPEYADFWALRWSDLLRVDRLVLGHKGAYSYYRWIHDSFAENKPYDQFVRELVAARGTLNEAPGGYMYKVVKKPGDVASTLSQVLLGVRIECAQCHHHPFDRWSQSDYFGMQAFFTQVQFKATDSGSMLTSMRKTQTKHPRSGELIYAHPLGTTNPTEAVTGDRRQLLAEWMTSPDNQWLARNLVNRMWAHMLGRGLVEPVDDVRSTNPPSNEQLLDALAKHFVANEFNVHDLIRTIAASRTYQLSATPNKTNQQDEQNYSRALFKRLDAEVLFDAVCQTTGVEEKFEGLPSGYRAIQLWDSRVPHYFLKLFGRPSRATACECERSAEPSVAQVLHVLNSPEIQSKLSHAGGRVQDLLKRYPRDNSKLIDELYLTCYSRYPTDDERAASVAYLTRNKQSRQQAVEDIVWSMMNTVEYLFNH